MNKEEIYDEKISPLMTQIIEICKEHKIATVASFAIGHEGDEYLMCTTALITDEFQPSVEQRKALTILRGHSEIPSLNITTHHADGRKTLETVLG